MLVCAYAYTVNHLKQIRGTDADRLYLSETDSDRPSGKHRIDLIGFHVRNHIGYGVLVLLRIVLMDKVLETALETGHGFDRHGKGIDRTSVRQVIDDGADALLLLEGKDAMDVVGLETAARQHIAVMEDKTVNVAQQV